MTMSFSATVLVHTTLSDGTKAPCLDPVFSSEETSEYLRPISFDSDEPLVDNPAYRPELDINLANANADFVLSQLGYKLDDGFFKAPIDEFIARLDAVLEEADGTVSPAIETCTSKADGGPTIIHLGLQEGYFERVVSRLAIMAREGKARGATMISAA